MSDNDDQAERQDANPIELRSERARAPEQSQFQRTRLHDRAILHVRAPFQLLMEHAARARQSDFACLRIDDTSALGRQRRAVTFAPSSTTASSNSSSVTSFSSSRSS